MTYVIIRYFKTERSWTIEILFSATSHPKGHENSDLRDGTIKVWITLLVLFWFGILAKFCSRHEEDYLTIWFFVEEILSFCQSWTSVFLFILIHFTWAMMMLDFPARKLLSWSLVFLPEFRISGDRVISGSNYFLTSHMESL